MLGGFWMEHSEPTFFLNDIGAVKLFVCGSQIDDCFDDSNNPHYYPPNSASQNTDKEHNDALGCHPKNEFVNSQGPHENAANSGRNFLAANISVRSFIRIDSPLRDSALRTRDGLGKDNGPAFLAIF